MFNFINKLLLKKGICMIRNVFIVGSKGIPAKYGGYETFVENLTKRKKNSNVSYFVSCLADKNYVYEYNGATCFAFKVPKIGAGKAIVYDLIAFSKFIKFIKKERMCDCCIYILTCRIGPFFKKMVRKAHKYGISVFVNPDGHEWLRSKRPFIVKKYWKLSEKLMIKYADFVICDSKNIEKYILDEYSKYNPKTTFIPYGADIKKSMLTSESPLVNDWFSKHKIKPNSYYLVVGRFVPENNIELIIKEFMKSNTNRDLVLISNFKKNRFFKSLVKKYNFQNDKRIKFVGTVYDEELLKKIRENAYAYIHGHSVGGTNPSLLEALASTKLNLLFDVGFNVEVGSNSCLYFSSCENSLSYLIDRVDGFSSGIIENYGDLSKKVINDKYSRERIIQSYENFFVNRTCAS